MPNRPQNETAPKANLATSFADVAELDAMEALGPVAEAILRDNGGELGPIGSPARAALIEAVRAGKHVELRARAITFRQKDGHPNKNFVRFKSSQLGAIAASYAGQPFLLDHDKWSQSSRKGTIEASEAVPIAGGWTGFRQVLRVVKPDAVISVLDGTIDRFSIGWDGRGQVICTVHKVDVRARNACWRLDGCYPGKSVEVDGETKIAEYEYQTASGTESSGVNGPAVGGTKIESISQLAAALEVNEHEPKERRTMKLPLLLAALGMKKTQRELSDDDDAELQEAALAIVEERDTATKNVAKLQELTTERDALQARVTELEGSQVDALLGDAYKAGKLIRAKDEAGKDKPSAREARLRRIAKVDGLAALQAELDEMSPVVPVGKPALAEVDPNPRASHGPISSSVLASTAKQLGIDPKELETHSNKLAGNDGGSN